MPVKTPHLGLEAFVTGDQYSASSDQRRMRLIDSHMYFLSSLIDDGIIEGWDISEVDDLTISISPGWGMINKFITRTVGPYEKLLTDNNSVYAWMKRRPGVIGQSSAFSNMTSLSYEDLTSPSIPSNIYTVSKSATTIQISWDEISEADLQYYSLYRSLNGSDFELIENLESNTYTDSNLEQDTEYFYKILSIDLSGNSSAFSSVYSETTDKDFSQPGEPSSVRIINSDECLHLYWRRSTSGNPHLYRAYIYNVTQENIEESQYSTIEISGEKYDVSISNLTNGQKYKIVLKSVSVNDVESDGIILYGRPDFRNGPKDVVNIEIQDEVGDGVISDLVVNISWQPFSDPYESVTIPFSYEIQVIEYNGQGGTINSEYISVLDTNYSLKVYPYIVNSSISYMSVRARTEYTFIIRSVDEDGNKSDGKVVYFRTRSFVKPLPPTQFSVEQRDNQSLNVKWVNSNSIFESNIFTFYTRDIENDTVTYFEEETDIGRSTSYYVSLANILPNTEYNFEIYAEDEFGNKSNTQSASFSIPDISSLPNPIAPSQQYSISGNKQVTIVWNKPFIEYFTGFNIYRSLQKNIYTSSDFQRIATVESSYLKYIDYEVENDQNYVYFVTTIDAYNNESLNPVDDDFFDYNILVGSPRVSGDISFPENLTSQADGSSLSDVLLTWDVSSGQFDGYEIYRSIGNKNNFIKIGNTAPSVNYFIDSQVLLKTSTYYYMVRKFINEADLFITESNIDVLGSVFLGKITTLNGEISIDTSGSRNIRNLNDPVREESRKRISQHKHLYYSEIDDRRINLGDELYVENWETFDYQEYSTTTDISSTTLYTVYLNKEKAENLGIFYALNKETGILTFETRLYQGDFLLNDGESYPFSEAPSVSVLFDNLSEVQNTLPKERLEDMSASQVSQGLISESQLEKINHNGRIKETLIPVTEEMFAIDDGYRFAPISKETEFIGSAIVWYDVIQSSSQNTTLVASTSGGIYVSEDFGLSWVLKFKPITPVLKLYYSESVNFYFALTNRGVLGTGGSDGFSRWQEIPGMENCKIARDIIEDANGNIFCSSDLGVFKLLKDSSRGSFLWRQTPIFGPKSTDSFAMLYDNERSRIIVSNELGIFETSNLGEKWDFSSEFPDQKSLFSLIQYDGTIFAVSKYIVWRKKFGESEFSKIKIFDDVNNIRHIKIYKNRLYISTDIGLLISRPENDIFSDQDVEFVFAFPQMKESSYTYPSFGLSIIDNKLFVCSENKLFVSVAHGRLSIHSQFNEGIVPTIYVDGVEQKIGYRFTTDTDRLRKFVCFDEKQSVNSIITFTNQYKKYKCINEGWIDSDYSSKIFMYFDGIKINSMNLVERPAINCSNIVWPSYNDRNAHKVGADSAFLKVQSSQNSLLSLSEQQPQELTGFTSDNVKFFSYSVERFLSQIYKDNIVIPELDINGNQIYRNSDGEIADSTSGTLSFIPFTLPKFNVLIMNSKNGVSQEGFETFGKYKEIYDGSGGIGSFGSELTGDE